MPWSTTSDIGAFVAAAGAFLSSRPVEHSPLLTEADYLRRRPQPEGDQSFGWWTNGGGEVEGAVLRAPRHASLLTPMPDAAVDELAEVLDLSDGLGCDVTTVDAVLAGGERAGIQLRPRHRLVIHRLDVPREPAPEAGRVRTADEHDHEVLDRWFDELMAANPGDPSDRAYVVDDPLADGRVLLWLVDGAPVAMVGRTPVIDGMTRVGALYVPDGDARVETALLAAASRIAAELADDVLVLAARDDRDGVARLAALGYRAVRERVLLSAG